MEEWKSDIYDAMQQAQGLGDRTASACIDPCVITDVFDVNGLGDGDRSNACRKLRDGDRGKGKAGFDGKADHFERG